MDDRPPTPVQSQDHQREDAPAQLQPPKPEDFRGYISDLDMTEEEENELLICLFNSMRIFVDLGFNINVIPQFISAMRELAPVSEEIMVSCEYKTHTDEFNKAAFAKNTQGESN